MGGALEILMTAGDAGEALFNLPTAGVAEWRRGGRIGGDRLLAGGKLTGVSDLLDVVTEGGCGGDPSGGCVLLLEQSGFSEHCHDVAQSG